MGMTDIVVERAAASQLLQRDVADGRGTGQVDSVAALGTRQKARWPRETKGDWVTQGESARRIGAGIRFVPAPPCCAPVSPTHHDDFSYRPGRCRCLRPCRSRHSAPSVPAKPDMKTNAAFGGSPAIACVISRPVISGMTTSLSKSAHNVAINFLLAMSERSRSEAGDHPNVTRNPLRQLAGS